MICSIIKNAAVSELEGTWVGEWDATELFVESMSTGDATMDKYFEFDDLVIGFTFEFEDDEMSLQVDEDSVEKFAKECADGLESAMVKYVEDMAEMSSLTVDELLKSAGCNDMDSFLATLGMDNLEEELIDEMGIDTEKETGKYEVKDDTIHVTYSNGDKEEMQFELDGDKLNLTYEENDMEMVIECQRK